MQGAYYTSSHYSLSLSPTSKLFVVIRLVSLRTLLPRRAHKNITNTKKKRTIVRFLLVFVMFDFFVVLFVLLTFVFS